MPIQDGTAAFEVRQIGKNETVEIKRILDIIYPVGTIYTTVAEGTPFASIGFGTWQEVGSGRVLQGKQGNWTLGGTLEAGLPNITGTFATPNIQDLSGAFRETNNYHVDNQSGDWDVATQIITFDASKANGIYGHSSTVQPPAYVVRFWKRTA